MKKLQPKIRHLAHRLRPLAKRGHVKEIRQVGMMVGIELIKDKERGLPYAYEEKIGARVCRRMRDFGIILRPLGPVIVLMPPLSITLKELDLLVDGVERGLTEVCGTP